METHEAELEIVGSKVFLSEQLELIERLAATDAPILITGETGVGKELVARTIHARSMRKAHSFAAVNSSALPQDCFTPRASASGMELPVGGTLFLDDVGDLSEPAQAGVLKLLQERPSQSRTAQSSQGADMRVLAAANINMQSAVDMGKFRSDLFFRLNEFSLHIKPLRERREDIPLLVEYFIVRYNKQYSRSVKRISDAALSFLKRYHFPGNVRELRNMIQNAVLMNDRGVIWIEDLPLDIVTRGGSEGGAEMLTIKQVEKRHIQSVLDYAGWNVSRASRVLGITRATLYDKIKTYSLAKP